MTTQQALDIFGSSISCQYFDGSDYVDGTFLYDSSYQMTSYNSRSVTDYIAARPYFLRYVATLNNVSTDRSYITVDVRPSYSIFDTSQLHTCIALSSGNVLPGGSFQSPTWDWFWGGSSVHLENNVLQQGTNGYRATLYIANANCTYVPCDFSSQSATSGYSVRACFYGNTGISTTQYYLYIGVPYVDADASGMNGTSTSVSGGSGGGSTEINVNVDVDMDETNGLLGDIADLLGGIVDGIKNLFIPDDEALEEFSDDLSDLLEDHLGGIYEAVDLIAGIWDQFENVSASSSIYIPPCNVPLAGSTLTLGDWTVPLKVDGMPQILYSSLAWIIDFIATASFLNMCRKKLEIFLNPDSEVVSNDN